MANTTQRKQRTTRPNRRERRARAKLARSKSAVLLLALGDDEQIARGDDDLLSSAELRKLEGGCSDMTIWRRVRDGILPKPIKLSGGLTGRNFWIWREYKASRAARVRERNAAPLPKSKKRRAPDGTEARP